MNRAQILKGTEIFRFNDVPVMVRPDFWPAPFLLTGLLSWIAGLRKLERSWSQRLLVGLLAMPISLIADVGHAMAHTVSARLSGAPMDEIFLSSGMPRTLYQDNTVPPKIHRLRALGGPVYSTVGFLLSLLWRRSSKPESLSRELADVSLASHSFILVGSLAPLPFVDGGTVLKWSLVERGRTPEQADQTVHRTSTLLGAALVGLGALLGLAGKRKAVGGLMAAGGAVGIAAGIDLLK